MKKALVAVIVPNYNRTTLLDEALESVFQQDFPDWRAFLVDDGSTSHEAKKIISKWHKKDPRFIPLVQKRRGVSSARNLGILSSNEPWIALLDSDDLWQPVKLSRMLSLAEKAEPKLWHSEEIWVRNGKRVNPKLKHKKGGGNQFERSTQLCVISPSAAFFPRSKICAWGIFDEGFPVAEDFDLWLRVTSREEVGFTDKPLITKRGGHPDQLSKSPLIDYWRIRALDKILKFGSLSKAQKEIVREELRNKLKILYLGAVKRKNLFILDFVEKYDHTETKINL